MSTLKFKGVNKIYSNNVQAVFDFNLDVNDKEFIVFVGPSGCGKSTTLRMLAGLEEITSGEIYIDNQLINDVPPKDRNIAMVFQNYALYPHMTVYNNMAYALRLRKIARPYVDENGNQIYEIDKDTIKMISTGIKKLEKDNCSIKLKIEKLKSKQEVSQDEIKVLEEKLNKQEKEIELGKKEIVRLSETPTKPKVKWTHYTKKEIDDKIQEAAKILGLEPYLKRRPAALSGGQRQRVALGRAIVRKPKVFLMDEPLSNLDAKLRVQMRSEISKIHQKVGATTIYVTHDQTEAMTMATRIVIMKDGWIQQIGTPKEVYTDPYNTFVGGFIGSPAMNFFNGSFDGENFVFKGNGKTNKIKLTPDYVKMLVNYKNKAVTLGVRPEHIYADIDASAENKGTPISIEADISELLGSEFIVYGYIDGQKVTIKTNAKNEIKQNSKHNYYFDMKKLSFFDPETTVNIKFSK